jgi:hypothetical protein
MHWKEQTFWTAVVGTFLASMTFAGFLVSRIQTEQPAIPTYRIIVEHITEKEVIQQAIFPVRQGKRSEVGCLSPEIIKQIENQTAKEVFSKDSRNPFERLR